MTASLEFLKWSNLRERWSSLSLWCCWPSSSSRWSSPASSAELPRKFDMLTITRRVFMKRFLNFYWVIELKETFLTSRFFNSISSKCNLDRSYKNVVRNLHNNVFHWKLFGTQHFLDSNLFVFVYMKFHYQSGVVCHFINFAFTNYSCLIKSVFTHRISNVFIWVYW